MPKQTDKRRLWRQIRQLSSIVGVGGLLLFVMFGIFQSVSPQNAYAATSSTLNFQARLLQANGALVPDGNYHIEFKLYDASSSSGSSQGSCTGDAHCLWTETRTTGNLVRTVNGYLTVNLGSVTAFPSTINWDQPLWLTMNVGGSGGSPSYDGEMTPRLQLTATPYAFRAGQLAKNNGTQTGTLSFNTVANSPVITLPDATGTVCLQNATACGFALSSSGAAAFVQGGNSFSAAADLGTNDSNVLNLRTNGTTKLTVSTAGDLTFAQGANRTLSVAQASSGAGNNLSIVAGQSGSGANNGGNLILQAGATGGSGTTGSVIVKANGTNSTTAFQVQQAGGATVLDVDTSNQRVGINTSSPATALEVSGALRLSGSGTDSFTTPQGGTYSTKINIPLYDPGAFGQVLALGLQSGASSTARVLTLFDNRAGGHQPSLAVLSPDESQIGGLLWNAGSTAFSLNSSKDLGFAIGANPFVQQFSGTDGTVQFQDFTDSTTGFNVLTQGGTSVLDVDTSNKRVGIGTAAPTSQLQVVGINGTNGSTGTAGAAGLSVTGGNGGNSSGASTAGGAGGAISLTAGNGGNSTGVAGTNGANISLQAGAGGTGSVAGSYGNILLQTAGGKVGVGTSGTPSQLLAIGGTTGNLTVDSSGNVVTAGNVAIQGANSLTLGTASNLGSIIFRDGSSAFTGTLQPSTFASSQVYTLGAGGLVCTDSGNCNGAGSSLQTAYNNSTGGSTPEIRLDTTRTGLDIQDANTTLGGTTNLLAVRAANSGGLGSILFGVQANGNVTAAGTLQATTGTFSAASSLTLGTASTNLGSITLYNNANNNPLTLQSGTTGGSGLTLTLPTADGSNLDCLKTDGSGHLAFGGCLNGGGSGGGVTFLNSFAGSVTITGTANQITVSNGANNVSLSTPQDIGTVSSPVFASLRTGSAPASMTTVTDSPLSSGATTINVVSTTGYPSGSSNNPGTLLIDSELVTYTGVTGTSFTGVVRGVFGTTAASHANGATVNNYLFNAAINTTSAPKFVIQGNGNVGIGTTAPASLLSVGASGQFQVNGSGNVTYVAGSASNNTLVCQNGSGQLAACSSAVVSGNAFVQNGNAFGATGVLGTTDANGLQIITGSSGPNGRAYFDTSNNLYLGNAGTAGTASSPNAFAIKGTGSSNVANAGAGLTVAAGAGATTTTGSAGGALALQGGAGGATTTGNANAGGAVNITGGAAGGVGAANANGGAISIQGGAGFGASGTTGAITIQTTSGNTTLGNTTAATQTLIQGGTGSSALALQAGTSGTISLGTANANTITIGNTTAGTVLNQRVATSYSLDGVAASTYAIGASTTTGTITIGGTAQTGAGTITLGQSTASNSILIGSGTGATTVQIANNVASATGNTVSIAGGATATGLTDTVNIATGNTVGTGAKVVHIADGNPAGTNTVTLGSNTATANVTTIQGGTGTGTGDLVLQTAASGIINIGTNAVTGKVLNLGTVGSTANASTIHIADTTGAANQAVTIASGISAAGNTAVVTIGSTNANTGSVTTIQGGSNTTAAIALAPNTAGGIMIGASAGTGTITLGQSTANNIINIGAAAGNGNTQTINIGNSATAGSTTNLVLGSTIAGTTTLQSAGGVKVTTLGASTSNSSTLCRDTSTTILTSCDGTNTTGKPFLNGLNDFAGTATLGTTSTGAGALQIQTSSVGRALFAAAANTLYLGNAASTGLAAAPNDFTIQGTSSSTSGTAGGALTVNGGTGNGAAAGGQVTFQGGTGGATGVGGVALVQGGIGGATSGTGGAATLQGGTAVGAFAGGTASVKGGTAAATAGSNGGAVAITAANGTSTGTGGLGGNVTITAGNAGGSGANNGGIITLQAGSATSSGTVGGVLVKNAANSTTAFQVQNATAGNLLQIDSSNANITLNGLNNGEPQPWTTTTALTTGASARDDANGVAYGGYIYIIGGNDGSAMVDNAIYNKINADGTLGSTWTATGSGLSSANQRNLHAVVAANGFIYVLGGSSSFTSSNVKSEVFYARINADGTLGAFTTTSSMPAARKTGAAAVLNGYIYYVAGDSSSTSTVAAASTVYYAKLNADGSVGTWNTTTGNSGNGLPGARAKLAVTAANGYLYAVGGNDGSTTQSSIYYVRPNASTGDISGNWTTEGTNTLTLSLDSESAYVLNGYLYAAGGFNGGSIQAKVYYAPLNLNGSVGSWTTAATANQLPATRGTFTSAAVNGYLYAIGGYSGSAATSTAYYTSTSRVKVGGSLDLIGLGGKTLADGGGGTLTAGNTFVAGTLQVTDMANLLNSLSVSKELQVGGSALIAGSVGIGTSAAPAAKLQVAAGDILLSNNQSLSFYDTDATSIRSVLNVTNAGNTVLRSANSSGVLALRNQTDNNLLTFTNNGNLTFTPQAATLGANTEAIDANLNLNRTVTFLGGAATSLGTQRALVVQAPTYAATTGTLTITDAATEAITGGPVKGTNVAVTNSYGLLIQGGAVGAASNSYGLSVNAQSGATNNYAAIFQGGNVGIATASPGYNLDVNGTGNFAGTIPTGAGNNVGVRITQTLQSSSAAGLYVGPTLIYQNNGDTNYGLNVSPSWNLNGKTGTTQAIAVTVNGGTATSANSSYGLYLTAASGATTNYAAVFLGGNVGIGTNGPTALFSVGASNQFQVNTNGSLTIAQSAVSGGQTALSVTPGNHTAITAEAIDLNSVGHTDTITGGYTTQRFNLFGQSTITAGSALTVTDSATVAIAGAPIKSGSALLTNTYGMLIQGGAVGAATNSYGLSVNAQTGATNNYAAIFQGGNVGIGTVSPTARLHIADSTAPAATVNATQILQVSGGQGGSAGAGQTGGTGSTLVLTAGTGGNATSATGTPGTGGTLTLQAGNGGNGTSTSTNGNGGNLLLQGGAAGTLGSGTPGTGGSVIVRPQTDSTNAFQIQLASTGALLTADTTNSVIKIGTAGSPTLGSTTRLFTTVAEASTTIRVGDGTNGVEFSGSAPPVYRGSGRPTKRITLAPEFPGATMTASSGCASCSGSMTSDAEPAAGASALPGGEGVSHTFYSWTTTQATNQQYDIWVNFMLPSDFSAFASSNPIFVWTKTSDVTNGTISLQIYSASRSPAFCYGGSSDTPASLTPTTTANQWQEKQPGDPTTGGCTFAANDRIQLRFRVQAPQSGVTKLGELRFDYLAKF